MVAVLSANRGLIGHPSNLPMVHQLFFQDQQIYRTEMVIIPLFVLVVAINTDTILCGRATSVVHMFPVAFQSSITLGFAPCEL